MQKLTHLLTEREPRGPTRGTRRRARKTDGEPVEVFQLTCGLDGRAHLASASGVDVAIAEERGVFPALCGRQIHAAALGAPPGPDCTDCHRHPHRRPGAGRP